MKTIKLRKGYIISVFNGPTESINPQELSSIFEPVEQNKQSIIDCVFFIEGLLEQIIAFYFYSEQKTESPDMQNFKNLILKSDWCTFSSKRKLVTHIINDLNLLKGKEKDNYQNLLKKSMSYRNAFAHGDIATDGREFQLSYFESTPINRILTDEYFSKIESELNTCFEMTMQLSTSIKNLIDKK